MKACWEFSIGIVSSRSYQGFETVNLLWNKTLSVSAVLLFLQGFESSGNMDVTVPGCMCAVRVACCASLPGVG